MTIVKSKVSGNKITAVAEGSGIEELRRVVEMMKGDFTFHLEVYADVTFKEVCVCNHEWLASTLPGVSAVCTLCGEKSFI